MVETVLEHLIGHGPDDIAPVFARAFELAMQIAHEPGLTGRRTCEGPLFQGLRAGAGIAMKDCVSSPFP
ncbi:MAG: hypothetical protein EA386_15700 [Rhodobacteraceae bacterium]|nr:MAG: hypothetical protein EA386_15700 [Paracoccaceae bacterium]